jgi:hypothetical protein
MLSAAWGASCGDRQLINFDAAATRLTGAKVVGLGHSISLSSTQQVQAINLLGED